MMSGTTLPYQKLLLLYALVAPHGRIGDLDILKLILTNNGKSVRI